ncbi:hypothetical protein K435DRAFT_644613 [Dendrothele bispora CBS 962.96]|uniref:BTB domain-containing protein n=1 Tax=Dendrothele bispora (strain CBS 962.96) TaxID=1314807 RepID=A0A4S8MUJ1_DENBC|nr:hypothetical protein K435DRAFT_644613 [Dendrothele bispora CBS 962.96]
MGELIVAVANLDTTPFHPLFSSPDADVVLACKGATLYYRLHSYTLKNASAFFRSMFSLPPKNHDSPQNEIIYLEEDENTLDVVFRMISGLPFPPIESYDLIDSMLDAVEKYEMTGVLSIIRIMVMTPALLDQPFRLYPIACRFGWEAEAKHASTQTLAYDLHDPELRPSLSKLSTSALLKLIDLHHSRREGLRQRLNDPPFVSGGVATCAACHHPIDYHTWRELKYKIILEMDCRPLGDTVLDAGLSNWPEALACWQAKCPDASCSRFLYDQTETVRVIRECVEQLPKTI